MAPPLLLQACSSISTSRSLLLLVPSTTTTSSSLLLLSSRRRRWSACCSSSSSYNGWSDLAAAPDLPLLPLPLRHRHGLLFLLPAAAAAAALALSLLPPLPLVAAAFTAGFAARHLSSAQSNPALLADLDAQLRALRAHLLSEADPDLLVQAVDRLRDALADAAAQGDATNPPVLGELADCLVAWARHAVRDLTLSVPRKKQQPSTSAPPVPSPKNNANSDVPMALDGGMLRFDDDDDVSGPTNKLGDARLERLVFKHRHGRGRAKDDQFQEAAASTRSSRFSTETMQSSLLEIRDRSYRFKIEHASQVQARADESFVDNAAATLDHPLSDQSASTNSDSEDFSRIVNEAAEILRKARESMVAMADEETADALLYKSATLLSAAVALRPTSLVAVGQLGNTYLLHGELKLKISRELRTLLANSGAFLNGRDRVSRSSRKVDSKFLSRDNISSALVEVCEECESLLVEAGRSYRTALSIDSTDVKALYNWGLALIFRAQLLADIGSEAAVDADRMYLAAIDKFDAMLSRSNTYAPEALYRWGTALQQRSHLRPRNDREKIRLLEQAKSLFEDVLYVEADNKMVREALSSCISELNYHGRWL